MAFPKRHKLTLHKLQTLVRRKPTFGTLLTRINLLFKRKVVTLDGIRVRVNYGVRSRIGVGPWLTLMNKTYESSERELLKATIRPGDRVLEIGGCLGVIGLLAARLIGEQNVVSYEANPALERDIRANYALNGIYPKLVMKAVTAEGRETVDFHVSGSVTGSSVWPIGDARKVRVDSEPIDQVIADHDPSVLVVDAEGAERGLLPSANLKNIRAIVVEFHPQIIGEDGVAEIKNALATKGFVPQLSRGRNRSV